VVLTRTDLALSGSPLRDRQVRVSQWRNALAIGSVMRLRCREPGTVASQPNGDRAWQHRHGYAPRRTMGRRLRLSQACDPAEMGA
jgi:hypothetical protein